MLPKQFQKNYSLKAQILINSRQESKQSKTQIQLGREWHNQASPSRVPNKKSGPIKKTLKVNWVWSKKKKPTNSNLNACSNLLEESLQCLSKENEEENAATQNPKQTPSHNSSEFQKGIGKPKCDLASTMFLSNRWQDEMSSIPNLDMNLDEVSQFGLMIHAPEPNMGMEMVIHARRKHSS